MLGLELDGRTLAVREAPLPDTLMGVGAVVPLGDAAAPLVLGEPLVSDAEPADPATGFAAALVAGVAPPVSGVGLGGVLGLAEGLIELLVLANGLGVPAAAPFPLDAPASAVPERSRGGVAGAAIELPPCADALGRDSVLVGGLPWPRAAPERI